MSEPADKYQVIPNDFYSGVVFPFIELDPEIFYTTTSQSRGGVSSIGLSVRSGAYDYLVNKGAVDIPKWDLQTLQTMKCANWGFRMSGPKGEVDLQYILWLDDSYTNLIDNYLVYGCCFTTLTGLSDWTPYFLRNRHKWSNACKDDEVFAWRAGYRKATSYQYADGWKGAVCRLRPPAYSGKSFIGLVALSRNNMIHPALFDLFEESSLKDMWGELEPVDDRPIHVPSESFHPPFPTLTQGSAVIADDEDLKRDEGAYTHPNLHRRIRIDREQRQYEVAQRKYNLEIQGLESYRTTESFTHDEQSTSSETP